MTNIYPRGVLVAINNVRGHIGHPLRSSGCTGLYANIYFTVAVIAPSFMRDTLICGRANLDVARARFSLRFDTRARGVATRRVNL